MTHVFVLSKFRDYPRGVSRQFRGMYYKRALGLLQRLPPPSPSMSRLKKPPMEP